MASVLNIHITRERDITCATCTLCQLLNLCCFGGKGVWLCPLAIEGEQIKQLRTAHRLYVPFLINKHG